MLQSSLRSRIIRMIKCSVSVAAVVRLCMYECVCLRVSRLRECEEAVRLNCPSGGCFKAHVCWQDHPIKFWFKTKGVCYHEGKPFCSAQSKKIGFGCNRRCLSFLKMWNTRTWCLLNFTVMYVSCIMHQTKVFYPVEFSWGWSYQVWKKYVFGLMLF